MKNNIYRIGNLALNHCSYLGEKPEHPSICIDLYYNNPDYNQQDKYKTKDGVWFTSNEYGISWRKHISCFKHKESCYSLASWEYDSNEPCWELKFIGNRPLQLTKEERMIFFDLVEKGYKYLEDNEE